MFIKIFSLLFLLTNFINLFECQLLFEDEFNELDSNKWEIIDSKTSCKRSGFRQITCDRNDPHNLKIISDKLAITVIQEKYFDGSFTSATIISRKSFNFESASSNFLILIRAAIPREVNIEPQIGNTTYYSNIHGNSNKKHRIYLKLGITRSTSSGTGNPEDDIELTRNFARVWKCSSIIIDYIRIFEFKVECDFLLIDKNEDQNDQAFKICNLIRQDNEFDQISRLETNRIFNRTLVWNEEFNGRRLDETRWDIRANDSYCEKHFSERARSCDRSYNVEINRLGYLNLKTRSNENIYGHDFSGATIFTQKCFTPIQSARIEIRAKKPQGSNLHTGLFIYLYNGSCNSQHIGRIDIAKMINFKDNDVWMSLIYRNQTVIDKIYKTELNLPEHQVFGIQWNESVIEWLLNDEIIYQVNQSNKGFMKSNNTEQELTFPFINEFKIGVHIGDSSFLKENESIEEKQEYVSDNFELDYIRVYDTNAIKSVLDNITANEPKTEILSPLVISLSSVMGFLIILLVLVCLLWRKQKSKNNHAQTKFHHNCEMSDHYYDDYVYGKEYETKPENAKYDSVKCEINQANSNISNDEGYLEVNL